MAVWVWIIFTLLAHEAMSSENKRNNFNMDPSLNPVKEMLNIQPVKRSAEKFHGSSSFEVNGLRVRREDIEDFEGSGVDDDYDDEDNDIEGTDEAQPSSPIAPSEKSPIFGQSTATPALKKVLSPSAVPMSKQAIRPTQIAISEPTDDQVEPTPVLKPNRNKGSSATRLVSADDYFSNSSFFEPIEPTASAEATPPLPDSADLSGIGPNLIGEEEEEEIKSPPSPPTVTKRLERIPVTAGKIFRFKIPIETFADAEDGNTRQLQLELTSMDGREMTEISWIAFNDTTQEIYGLPLAEDIGSYSFKLWARNSANLSVSELAEIRVRQHQSERAFNHRFTLQLEPEFDNDEMTLPSAFWMLKTVGALSKVLGDREDSIVVRSVSGTLKNGDAFTLSWSNDSLPRTLCPENVVASIFDKFYNLQKDEVTTELDQELAPQLAVTYGNFSMDGNCKPLPTMPVPTVKTPELSGGLAPKVNHQPTVTNAVDHVDAEVGVLFRFQVPVDTFYDEEDGATRMLKLTLNNMNNGPLSSRSWLQFDVPNQEFYGLPMDSDAGLEEYQLVCTDSGGLTASDGLVVSVKDRSKLPEKEPLVEFTLTIKTDFETLTDSAHRKVRLIESIARIFDDPEPRNVVIRSFQPGSTLVTWSNATLVGGRLSGSPDDETAETKCPDEEILSLRRKLLDDDSKLTQSAIDILSASDFEPVSARMTPMGRCIGQLTPTYGPDTDDATIGNGGIKTGEVDGDKTDDNATWSDDYLLTFIVPGIIITVMLLLAAVIACVLYRRRRTGKLGLEERRSFVSKGIPIIFAEELEERPSGRHPAKAPVILKEEKPSQPPPDYHKLPRSGAGTLPGSGSPYGGSYKPSTAEQHDLLRTPSDEAGEEEPAGLYQPPPPLSASRDSTSSSRYSRPKATPAYRKPPPYVPP